MRTRTASSAWPTTSADCRSRRRTQRASRAAIAAASLAQAFGNGNGVPPTATINIINNDNPAGPINNLISVSPSTGLQDYNFDAALCHRNLWTGTDAFATRVQVGVKETLRTGNLRGKPAIIVHGRADGFIPVNMNSRPYYGQNKIVEGAASKLSYIEVTNAQHFDSFIDNVFLPGYDSAFVPLHVLLHPRDGQRMGKPDD